MRDQFRLLADYNTLMNRRLFTACSQLTDEQLREERHAFFGSVLGTLNHLLVGDIIWLQRFAAHPSSAAALSYLTNIERPPALNSILYDKLAPLQREREHMDLIIRNWIGSLTDDDLADCIHYTNMAGKRFSKPYDQLITHLFLHQVHHRGQATTLLSQYGIDFGETDLIELIDDYPT